MHPVVGILGELFGLVLLFGCSRPEQPDRMAPPADSVQGSPSGTPGLAAGGTSYPMPLLDLAAERLSERVDGAEVKLRALGCLRLRVWRIAEPAADVELYAFSSEQGARRMLDEQTNQERSPNVPGDEGWLGTNALYFRRGAMLVQVIADAPATPESLLGAARNMELALARGEVAP